MPDDEIRASYPHPWRRGLPPLWWLAGIGAMLTLDRYAPGLRWIEEPWGRLAWLPWAAGGGLLLWSAARFGAQQTTVHPFRRSASLVTSGPYRISRNPMYLGLALILVGLAVKLGSLSPWVVVPLFMAVIEWLFIRPEEAILEARFGSAYRRFCGEVRRWL